MGDICAQLDLAFDGQSCWALRNSSQIECSVHSGIRRSHANRYQDLNLDRCSHRIDELSTATSFAFLHRLLEVYPALCYHITSQAD